MSISTYLFVDDLQRIMLGRSFDGLWNWGRRSHSALKPCLITIGAELNEDKREQLLRFTGRGSQMFMARAHADYAYPLEGTKAVEVRDLGARIHLDGNIAPELAKRIEAGARRLPFL